MTLAGFDGEEDLHVMMNMYWNTLAFEVPVAGDRRWFQAVNTADSSVDVAGGVETIGRRHLPRRRTKHRYFGFETALRKGRPLVASRASRRAVQSQFVAGPVLACHSDRGSGCAHAHPELSGDRSILPSTDALPEEAPNSSKLQPIARIHSRVAGLPSYFEDIRFRQRIPCQACRPRLRIRALPPGRA